MSDRDRDIKELLEAESNAAEGTQLSPDAVVTRGHERAKILSVRLNQDEIDSVQKIADERGLPVSTLVRSWINSQIKGDAFDPDGLQFQMRRLIQKVGELDAKVAEVESRKAPRRKSA